MAVEDGLSFRKSQKTETGLRLKVNVESKCWFVVVRDLGFWMFPSLLSTSIHMQLQ